MAEVEIKWGLGTIIRTRKPIKMYHVVIDGKTRASFDNETDAKAWAYDWARRNPTKRHDFR